MAALRGTGAVRGATRSNVAAAGKDLLRTFIVIVGLAWSAVFIVVGLRYELQSYGDGALFSYSVAAQDAWAFHWHNISGRLLVYLACFVPAQTYVALTGDAHGGITLYGLIHFAAPMIGLVATGLADRSPGRIIFAYACLSTAVLCPLVYGYPTEVWMAHVVFWPALAICHQARNGIGGFAATFVAMLALAFTHEGAVIFALAIVATMSLRGWGDQMFRRTIYAFLAVMLIWTAVKIALPPDVYTARILTRNARHFFNVADVVSPIILLTAGAIAGYAVFVLALHRLPLTAAHLCAGAIVVGGLCVYWLWLDRALHADARYYVRSLLVIFTPILGFFAAAHVLDGEGRLYLQVPLLQPLRALLAHRQSAVAIGGALALVALVHAVETAKFVAVWTDYRSAMRALAMSTASDPELGDHRFVSAVRIKQASDRLSWNSTTPFLSVLVSPGFAPTRLVVDPDVNYFWFSCVTATANENAEWAIPREVRHLVRVYACLHR
jgi:hypothetical protein